MNKSVIHSRKMLETTSCKFWRGDMKIYEIIFSPSYANGLRFWCCSFSTFYLLHKLMSVKECEEKVPLEKLKKYWHAQREAYILQVQHETYKCISTKIVAICRYKAIKRFKKPRINRTFFHEIFEQRLHCDRFRIYSLGINRSKIVYRMVEVRYNINLFQIQVMIQMQLMKRTKVFAVDVGFVETCSRTFDLVGLCLTSDILATSLRF